jgi:hypothetical protein
VRRALTGVSLFTREYRRDWLSMLLLVSVPAIFVPAAAGTLSQFAAALGGSISGNAATSLSAGWSAAFISGAIGFFQARSSREADHRLSLAGLGGARVASARVVASVSLAVLASAVAFIALVIAAPPVHPLHAAAAVLSFALIYVGVGTFIGSIVDGALEGSLLVVLVFMLDAFSGPGMQQKVGVLSVSRKAADLLIDAASGRSSSSSEWLKVAAVTLFALLIATTAFAFSARRRR